MTHTRSSKGTEQRNASRAFVSLIASLLLPACSAGTPDSSVGPTDEALAAIEAKLSSGANTALCVEYIGLCEQGMNLCLQGNNAQTYQSFCSTLQSRCRATTAQYCTPGDGGAPPVDAGAHNDSGTDGGGGFHAPPPTSNLVVNVKNKGATGNGHTNDTAAIQAAVNQVAGTGGTVLVPDGTYMIDAVARINLGSNMTFKMTDGAILKAIPNGSSQYTIVQISGRTNVNVVGGTLWGERHQHLVPGDMTMDDLNGQWGFGLSILNSSHVYVESVLAKECWGDGFYVSNNSGTDVNFYSVTADANRRQGMSVVASNGVVIRNSVFKNTIGAPPQAGIDLEPNAGQSVNDVKIWDSQFLNNHGDGLAGNANAGAVSNILLSGSTFSGNAYCFWFHKRATGVTTTGNTCK